MGLLNGMKNLIFGEPEPPEPEPEVFFIFGPKPKPEAWREAEEEAREEWREEREDRKRDAVIAIQSGSWEEAKALWPNEITDGELREVYEEGMGW